MHAFFRAFEDRLQVVPVDELHGDVIGVLNLPQVVDVNDVVVIELRRQLGLIDEHVDEFAVVG